VKLELFPLRTIRFAEHDTHSPKTCYIGNNGRVSLRWQHIDWAFYRNLSEHSLLHRKQWELSLLRLVDNIRGDNHW